MADVVKNITANINIVPKGIDDAKAKLQELLKSSNISEAVKIDIKKALSKIEDIGPKIQGQLSSGAINVDRLGIGKIEDAIFALAKKINKEMGIAFDTTKVDAIADKIKDIESKLSSSAANTQLLEKNVGKVQSEINKKGEEAGLGMGFKGSENVGAVRSRLADLEEKQDKGKKGSEAYKERAAEIKRLIKYLEAIDPLLKKQDDYNAKILEKNKEQVRLGEEAAKLQAEKSVAIKEAVAKTPEAQNIMGAAEDVGSSKKELLDLQNKQKQASVDEAEAVDKLDNSHKKHKKTLLEKIFALLTFQKIMGFVNRVIKDSIRTITDLDRAMTDVAITTNLSREEAWKYLGAMQALAKETGLATSQISGVVVQFLRQGRSMADAFELAEVAAKSAKVAGISASEAVNFLTSAVNGFGLAANQAEAIADKFSAIAAKSATSFAELALAMSKVSPTAKASGVSIDFMMGVIAKGIETTREAPENIGTAFKTIFARMREVTDIGKSMEDGMSLNRVEKALESVGVSLRDSTGQFRNLETVLTEVGRKWENLTSIEQAYLATALAGSRQQPRLLAIFNDFARTEDLIAISASAAGELEDQHLEYMEGLEAAMTRMKNAWEQVVTAFMSSEVIIQIVNFLTGLFETLADVIGGIGNPIQNTTVLIIGLTIALGAYTIAKQKAALAEKISNDNGVLTAAQVAKETLLRIANVGAINAEVTMLQLQNTTMAHAISQAATALVLRAKMFFLSIASAGQLKGELLLEQAKNATMMQSIGLAATKIGMDIQELAINARKFIVDKGKLIVEKTTNVVKAIGLALSKAQIKTTATNIFLLIKESLAKGVSAIWSGILAVANFFLSGSFIALGAAILSALVWLLPFIVAGAILAAGLYLIVVAFVYATKSVDDYAKNIAKANKEMKELENKEENVKKLAKRFQELSDKVEKTAEDLDEMKSIAEELGEVKVGDKTFNLMTEDAFGNAVVDQEEYNKYLEASAAERQKLLQQEQGELNTAIARFGASAMDNKAIANSARRAGYRMVEEMIGGLEEGDTELEKKVADSVKQALSRTDMSAFVNEGFLGIGAGLDTKALEKFTKMQAQLFADYYKNIETIQKKEADLIKSGEMTATEARVQSIEERMAIYNNAIDQIEARTDLTEEQKLEMIANVKLTMSGEAALIELIENRQIDVTLIANMQLSGMNLNEIGDFLQNSQGMADEAAGVTVNGERARSDFQLGVAGVVASAAPAVPVVGGLLDTAANIFTLGLYKGNFFSTALDNLVDGQQAILDEQAAAEERSRQLFEQNNQLLMDVFDGEDIKVAMDNYRAFLIESMGLTEEEAQAEIDRLYNALGTKTSSAIAGMISDVRSDREKLYALPEELAKGNFEGLVDLATQYGTDAIEAFLSGDPAKMEEFFAAQKEKTLNEIDKSIEALQGKGDLSDAEQAELLALQKMREYYDDMSAADQERVYWLGRSKELLQEMNEILKIAKDLMTMGLSEEHPLIAMLNSLADAKYDSAIEGLQTQLENEMEALSEFGTFDENGVFVFNEGADMVAGQAALDGYLETLGEYTSTLVAEYNRQADIIKKRYQAEIDAIKDAHSERWKEIEYLDKVKELEEKIIDARRQLMAFSLDGSMAGQMTDSLESLQKIQQERQKMIEQQMMEQAQKELEAERDDALIALGQQQILTMEGLIDSLDDLNGTMRRRNDAPVNTDVGGSPTSGGSRNFVQADTVGIF